MRYLSRFFIIAAVCAASFATRPAAAQSYPSAPIRLIVGFPAGGGTDVITRVYSKKLETILGVAVLVENRPGAAQLIAARYLKAAKPDGYTLMVSTTELIQHPSFRSGIDYDPLKDFTIISMMAKATGVFIVDPKLPIHTLPELIAYAKANPGKLTFATSGVGSTNQIALEYLMHATGGKMTHVPYKSDQEATAEVGAGRVSVALTIANFSSPMAREGKVRALAVTGFNRISDLPDVPSFSELDIRGVKPLTYHTYYNLIGPAGIDPAIVDRLNAAIAEASASPEVIERLKQLYLTIDPGTPAQSRAFLTEDFAMWQQLAALTGLRF